MNCDTCRELIPEFLEKSLSADTARNIELHLRTCPACLRELAETQALLSAVRGLERPEPGADTILRISEDILRPAAPARRAEFGSVLDVDDLAEYLRVGRDVLDLYVDEIPHFELGGRILFRKKSVEQWIEARERLASVHADVFAGDELVTKLV